MPTLLERLCGMDGMHVADLTDEWDAANQAVEHGVHLRLAAADMKPLWTDLEVKATALAAALGLTLPAGATLAYCTFCDEVTVEDDSDVCTEHGVRCRNCRDAGVLQGCRRRCE